MKTNIIKCIAILMLLCLFPMRMWADESFEGSFAWDLTTDSYVKDPTKQDVYWEYFDIAKMNLNIGNNCYTGANSKLGGNNNKYTRISENI